MIRQLTEQGLRFLEEGQLDKARSLLSRAMAEYPDDAEAYNLMALIELEQENFALAHQYANTAIAISQNNAGYYTTLANIEVHRNNLALAEQAFLKACDCGLTKGKYLYNLAQFYMLQQEYNKAINVYYNILEFDPQHYLAMRGLTLSYLLLGETEIAATQAANWALEYSNQYEPDYYQGLCSYSLGNKIAALKHYEQAQSKTETSHLISNAVAACYLDLGNAAICRSYLHQSLAEQPRNIAAIYQLACLESQLANRESAEQLLTMLSKLDPTSSAPQLGFAKLAIIDKEYIVAHKFIAHALSLDPNCVEAKVLQAQCYLRVRDFDKGWPLLASTITVPNEIAKLTQWHNSDKQSKQSVLLWFPKELNNQNQILLSSLLQDADKLAKHVYVLCQPHMAELLKHSFAKLHIITNLKHNRAKSQLSIFALAEITRPKANAYLRPNAQRVEYYKNKYQKLSKSKQTLGICWHSGNIATSLSFRQIQHHITTHYSSNWQPMVLQPAIHADCPYYFETELDYQSLDMLELASAIAAMDRILSVDATVLHLAAALGVESECLLTSNSEWYWFDSVSENMWYPHLNLKLI